MKTKSAGFTLIELLVVIAILGILTTLLVSNVAGVRERARDAQRKSDLKEIQNALQMYKQDQVTPAYPVTYDDLVAALENDKYLRNFPPDPLEGSYLYRQLSTDSLDYRLKACLENKSDPQGQTDNETVEVDPLASCDSGVKFELNAP